MSRPSKHYDKILIEAGKKKLINEGIVNISIRSICIDANVNLGMFHYYFKSKENYLKVLFKDISNNLRNELEKEIRLIETPIEKLKASLLHSVKLMSKHRGTFKIIFRDVDLFDKFYFELGKELNKEWFVFYSKLFDECKNDGSLDTSIENEKLISIIFGAVTGYSRNLLNYGTFSSQDEFFKKIKDVINLLVVKFK